MSTGPNQYIDGFAYNIVSGGHQNRPSPGKEGNCQVFDPTRHGPGVDETRFPFIPVLVSATQEALETNNNPPEPGSACLVTFGTGEPGQRLALGVLGGQVNEQGSSPGNNPLYVKVDRAAREKTGKRRKPNIKESADGGARVYETSEKSDEWFHNLTRGIASHAAYPQIAGTILPSIRNIDTAIQQHMLIPTPAMLANLPGAILNLNNLIRNLTRRKRRSVFKNVPQDVILAAETLFDLMTEVSESSYMTDGRGDAGIFETNVLNLLSQARSLSDVLEVIGESISNTGLHGLENLANMEVSVNTPYGSITLSMDPSGALSTTSGALKIIQSAISGITSLLGIAQSGAPGKFLFGEAAELVNDAINRIPNNIRTKMIKSVPELARAANFDEIHKRTISSSGKPLAIFV